MLSYLRRGDGRTLVVVLNFTPEPRTRLRDRRARARP